MTDTTVHSEGTSQPQFLVKVRGRDSGKDVIQTDALHVRYRSVTRVKRDMGIFREVEHDHWDRQTLSIRTATDPIGGYGRTVSSTSVSCPKTAAGVKAVVRRLRDQEADELSAIDSSIAALNAEIVELRKTRRVVVQAAWSKAHVVRLNELDIESPRA